MVRECGEKEARPPSRGGRTELWKRKGNLLFERTSEDIGERARRTLKKLKKSDKI